MILNYSALRRRLFFGTLLLFGVSATPPAKAETDATLKLHYTFGPLVNGTVQDVSGNGYAATLYNQASVNQWDGLGFLSLGVANGYLDMGSSTGNLIYSLSDFTVATWMFVDPSAAITGDGNFLWNFSSSASCGQTTGKYIAYRVNAQRYALATAGWSNEKVVVSVATPATKRVWTHVAYTQSGTIGKLYLNGLMVKSGTASYQPKDLGAATLYNWIGRSPFPGDNYLRNTAVADFRIYNRALDVAELAAFTTQKDSLTVAFNKLSLQISAASLTLNDADTVVSDVKLPALNLSNVSLTWRSSHPTVLSESGYVYRPAFGHAPVTVQLTAVLKCDSDSLLKTFTLVVLPQSGDAESVQLDLTSLKLQGNLTALRSSLRLPSQGTLGTVFSWVSSRPDYLTHEGVLLKSPAKGEGAVTVTLTVTAQKGTVSSNKVFAVTLAEEMPYSAYLFAYFTGNSGTEEAIRFALSPDGLHYRALNNNLPIISSDTIAQMQAIRDPHIYRGQNGEYLMVVTDMKSANGWSSNHGMVFLKSYDLVNWTHHTVDVAAIYPAFSTVNRCWAPQVIWDSTAQKNMVYWSMRSGSANDVLYYAYANADFTSLETDPKVLFAHPTGDATIDADIIYKDGVYNLFYKNEGTAKGITKAVSSTLTGPYVVESSKYLHQTSAAVEAPCVFQLINSDTWVLMYDVYSSGRYEFTQSTDLNDFRILNGVTMNFAPRHGTVLQITADEAAVLAQKWGQNTDLVVLSAGSSQVKKLNIVVDEAAKTVFLPVKNGTDLTAFDPKLQPIPGVTVSPSGPQDFSKGAVTYTLSLNGNQTTYSVSASVCNNPVLTDLYADPEILYSEKDTAFYLYPTCDGYNGWYSRYFDCFSSRNLVDWKDEGTLLNLESGDVSWASTYAWAPCMVEKKINGEYRYFYYFSANKQVGVAVASSPKGPFVDSGKALISSKPTGVTSGQEIDPDVFTDPVSGKSYIYWGNGYMAGAELNDDMISFKSETVKVMTPNSTFREGTYVIYRNGIYYFMWSENDTGSSDYRVRYATSDSPLGTLIVPANNFVVLRNDAQAIYGTGHNAVVQIPGKDEWYIVYHRLSRPNAITYASPGNFREVCMDKLEFGSDGKIIQVTPTLEGITPVSLMTSLRKTLFQKKKAGLTVWPNPVKKLLNIEWPSHSEKPVSVEILKPSGLPILYASLTSTKSYVDCSELASGFYLIRASLGGETLMGKFVKCL
jgi:hypothetical protein